MSHPSIAYVNGKFVSIEQARISIFDRGFLFADGVYEVAAVIDGRLIDLQPHLQRLDRSLREMQITPPIQLTELPDLMNELVQREALDEGMVYLQITRGADSQRSFSFPKSPVTATLVMFVQAKPLIDDPLAKCGATAISIADIRWRRRDIKSVSLLPQVLGKQVATAAGVFEAIMIEDGFVTEGTSSAVGLITDENELVTRPISNDILRSITRQTMATIAESTLLTITERPFTIDEAYQAAECFVASATALIMPIVKIDDQTIGNGQPGKWTTKLRQMYLQLATSGSGDSNP